MSKISGIDLGDPNKPFQVFGSQLGGRDSAITVQRPNANIRRDQIAAVTKELNARIKDIRKSIDTLEVIREMMIVDKETDSVILDKNFVDEYTASVNNLRKQFEEMLKSVNQQ